MECVPITIELQLSLDRGNLDASLETGFPFI